MRNLLITLSIVLLLMGCDTEPMSNQEKLIEESFNADNPFIGIWEPIDKSNITIITFNKNMWHELFINQEKYNEKNPVLEGTYSFDGNKLHINCTNAGYIDCIYNFNDKHTFFYGDYEYKKVALFD